MVLMRDGEIFTFAVDYTVGAPIANECAQMRCESLPICRSLYRSGWVIMQRRRETERPASNRT